METFDFFSKFFVPRFKKMADELGTEFIPFSFTNETWKRLYGGTNDGVYEDITASYEIALFSGLDCVEL